MLQGQRHQQMKGELDALKAEIDGVDRQASAKERSRIEETARETAARCRNAALSSGRRQELIEAAC